MGYKTMGSIIITNHCMTKSGRIHACLRPKELDCNESWKPFGSQETERDLQMEEDYAQGHVVIDAICEKKSDGFVSGGLLWKNLLER